MYDEPHRDTAETERFGDEPPSPRGGRNLWLWLGAVAVAALVIVAAVFALTRDGDDEAEGTETAAVPAVVGLQEDQATLLLEETGFEVAARSADSPEPAGTVVAQDPEAETELELGSTVTITVSAGEAQTETVTVTATETEPPPTVAVPDLVGVDHTDAGSHVDELGLIADTFPVDSDEPRGTVVAQDPAAGTEVASTEHVRLDVSVGPGEREVGEIPDVTGPRGARARAIARETGWTVRTVDRDAPSQDEVGEVILQEPEAGSEHPVLTQITLYVGR